MQISDRVSQLKPSPTLELNQKAKTLQTSGKSVINLTVGEPDLPTPKRICNAAIEAIERRETKYTASTGIVQLKDAILETTKKTYGRSYDRSEVMVSAGAKQALYNLSASILNEGDEAIVLAPYWVSYLEMVRLAGGRPVVVETKEEENFTPSISRIEKAITSKTRLIFLNSPCNPTGGIYSPKTIEEIANLVKKHPKIVVATDDIYERFLFDGNEFASIGKISSFPKDQLVIVHGVSKSYAMTGWRIGYALAPKALISAMDVIQSNATSNATSIAQWAALEALKGDQKDVSDMCSLFEKRRNTFYDQLVKNKKLTCMKPKGAFYFFPNVKGYLNKTAPSGEKILDDITLASHLLSNFGVALVPGSAFGSPGYLRISFAASNEELKEGLERVQNGLDELK